MGRKTIHEQILDTYREFNEQMLMLRAKEEVNYRSCENTAKSCSTCYFHSHEQEKCLRYMRDDTDIIFSCICDDYWPAFGLEYTEHPPNYRITDQPGCLSCEHDDKDGFCAYIQDETEYFDNFICDKYQLKEKNELHP